MRVIFLLSLSCCIAQADYAYDYKAMHQAHHPYEHVIDGHQQKIKDRLGWYKLIEPIADPDYDASIVEVDPIMSMYSSKCNNGIVGLFCQGYGCYYNHDCYLGYCNMYNKCEVKPKPQYISDHIAGGENSIANNSTALLDSEMEQNDAIDQAALDIEGLEQVPNQSSQNTTKPSAKELQQNHFKKSPFANSDQLNGFLMWFGIFAALLIMAFIIQCCREIARGEDTAPAVADKRANSIKKALSNNALVQAGAVDQNPFLSNTQSIDDDYFKKRVNQNGDLGPRPRYGRGRRSSNLDNLANLQQFNNQREFHSTNSMVGGRGLGQDKYASFSGINDQLSNQRSTRGLFDREPQPYKSGI